MTPVFGRLMAQHQADLKQTWHFQIHSTKLQIGNAPWLDCQQRGPGVCDSTRGSFFLSRYQTAEIRQQRRQGVRACAQFLACQMWLIKDTRGDTRGKELPPLFICKKRHLRRIVADSLGRGPGFVLFIRGWGWRDFMLHNESDWELVFAAYAFLSVFPRNSFPSG